MKKIQLGGHTKKSKIRGYAIVDDWNYNWLNQWRWSLHPSGYAYRLRYNSKKGKYENISMHQIIHKNPKGSQTDHINRDPLDNREQNLRTATSSQNRMNIDLKRNNTSGYKGVYWHKRDKQWMVRIQKDYKQIFLGNFHDKKIAALRYNIEARELFGKYAKLNIIKF